MWRACWAGIDRACGSFFQAARPARSPRPAQWSSSAATSACHHTPRRLLTTLPLNAGQAESDPPSTTWQRWLDSEKRSAALIGGSSRSHYLSAKSARQMAERLSTWAAEHNSSLLLVTSRRSRSVLKHLAAGLGPNDLLYAWRSSDPDNPYKLVLDNADHLVVTGESESMLADAASRGRGFLVWALPERSGSPWRHFCTRVAERAVRPRFNRRGSIRPQQGLSYLCARALERNWILPPRRLDQLHQALYKAGLAAPFGETAPSNFKQADELQTCLTQAAGLLNIDLQAQSKKSENEKPHEQQRQPHS
ncbi:MAG: ELM1/GtrOC1 family putative glycosyltransferase [Wenzhouxiangella sp.]